MATAETKKEQGTKAVDEKLKKLKAHKDELKQGGGKARIAKQHEGGKLTARERIEKLADPNSFQEIGLFARHRCTNFDMAEKEMPSDGVVTGAIKVDGKLVHVASQDFTVSGGSAGEMHND